MADRLYAFYVMALDSGMRVGELLALQWSDINLEGGYVTVRRTLEDRHDRLRVKETKTKKSQRRIPLAPQTLSALHDHRKGMFAEGHASGPVFCDRLGGFIRISNLRNYSFLKILKRAGLPPIRLYDLRHTSATLLLLADVSPKVISERLGHSTIALTLDVYSHVLPSMGAKAAETMGRILGHKPAFKTQNR